MNSNSSVVAGRGLETGGGARAVASVKHGQREGATGYLPVLNSTTVFHLIRYKTEQTLRLQAMLVSCAT